MNCEKVEELISLYIDGELPRESEGALFTHLSTCDNCRKALQEMQQISTELKLRQVKLPSALEERIFSSIARREGSLPANTTTTRMPVYVSYALVAVVVILALFSFLQISALRSDLNAMHSGYTLAIEHIQQQSRQLDLLMNSAPAVEITGHPVEF